MRIPIAFTGLLLIALAGWGGELKPVNAPAPRSNITFKDSFAYPDGTQIGGQTAPTGQHWSITGYDIETAQVWSNELVHYPQGSSASGPWYAYVNTGSAVHAYSARFRLVANGGANNCAVSAMIIYANPNSITDKMIHTELNCRGIVLTWWNGSSQHNFPVYSSAPTGAWVSGMTMTAGNTYTVTLMWDGSESVYFIGPDGLLITFRDPNFASVGGAGIIWEEAADPTDSLYTKLANVTTMSKTLDGQ